MVDLNKLKKAFKLGYRYQKVTVWYLDDDGCARMEETTRPPKGLTMSERAKIVIDTLNKHGFDLPEPKLD
jgi:outer membrane receptor for Fe3+-dicitrate